MVNELFEPVCKWEPKTGNGAINGVFADSLAALSTELELADGDKYGMRRAKEFSEECRKVCRAATQRNLLMVCSNQVRTNLDTNPWAEKYITRRSVDRLLFEPAAALPYATVRSAASEPSVKASSSASSASRRRSRSISHRSGNLTTLPRSASSMTMVSTTS